MTFIFLLQICLVTYYQLDVLLIINISMKNSMRQTALPSHKQGATNAIRISKGDTPTRA